MRVSQWRCWHDHLPVRVRVLVRIHDQDGAFKPLPKAVERPLRKAVERTEAVIERTEAVVKRTEEVVKRPLQKAVQRTKERLKSRYSRNPQLLLPGMDLTACGV